MEAIGKNGPGTRLQQRLTEALIEGRLLELQVCGDEERGGPAPETFFCISVVPEQYDGLTITLRPVAVKKPVVILGTQRAAHDG